ncbi:aromatic acid exporter family protein [Streptomyces sp. NPDC059355]|uniref:aromatic acid exporter family protein n=1 Tax=Streptomyces sp. NPDC059355 TaxID=3346811 RepID=UPI00367A2279
MERADYLRRAVRRAGSERDEVLLGAKSVIAAMAAWVLARYLLPPAVSTFAPFTALVALQATVYRSVRDCLQYGLAMAAGATLAATLAAVAGIHGWTFGLLTLLALRLVDLADTLEASDPDRDHLRQWRRDWHRLSAECERIRHAIEAEIENGRMNPRRTISGSGEVLPRAREAITVAERSMDHLRSMTRTLDHALESGELGNLPATFRPRFSAVLRAVPTAMEEIGQASHTDPNLLDVKIGEAAGELDGVQREERTTPETSPAAHALQGTLLTDAGRILADLRPGRQSLAST